MQPQRDGFEYRTPNTLRLRHMGDRLLYLGISYLTTTRIDESFQALLKWS